MSEVTDNTKTLDNALARIETLEAEKEHLLKVIKGRKEAGLAGIDANGETKFLPNPDATFGKMVKLYFISDEYDAAGFLITPEVKIEQ